MSIFSFTIVILHLAFCWFTAKGADITLKCPQKWRNGCKQSLYCTLQTANFTPQVCTGQIGKTAEFLFKGNAATLAQSDCAVNISTSCVKTFRDTGCARACKLSYGNGYTFQHNVVVDGSKQANGSWFCTAECIDRNLNSVLSTSSGVTCSNITINYGFLKWRGIVLLCVGAVLVIVGIIMINAIGLGITGKVGIAVCCTGYILLIAGSALMNVEYVDDEPAGIAFLWVGSVLLIIPGTGISIIYTGDPGATCSTPKEGGSQRERTPQHVRDVRTHRGPPQTGSAADDTKVSCLMCDPNVLAKVGIFLMWVGGTLAIIGGIVAATEPCPSDDFSTTLQEILGLVLAVIGFVVFFVGIIIGIVALIKIKTKLRDLDGTSTHR